MTPLTVVQVDELLAKVDPKPFTADAHVHQVRNILKQMLVHRFGQEFLYFNLKEVFKRDFPIQYVTDFRLLCNQVLRSNRRETIPDDSDFLAKLS